MRRENGAVILLIWVLVNLFGIMFEMKEPARNQVTPAWGVVLPYTPANI